MPERNQENERMIESLKSYPPEALLKAALSHDLPPQLRQEIGDFLDTQSTDKSATEIDRPRSHVTEEAERTEWAGLVRAYNNYYSAG